MIFCKHQKLFWMINKFFVTIVFWALILSNSRSNYVFFIMRVILKLNALISLLTNDNVKFSSFNKYKIWTCWLICFKKLFRNSNFKSIIFSSKFIYQMNWYLKKFFENSSSVLYKRLKFFKYFVVSFSCLRSSIKF